MYYNAIKHSTKIMKEPKLFWDFYIRHIINAIWCKLTKKYDRTGRVWGRKIHTNEEANRIIYNGLMSERPFSVMRNGIHELNIVTFNEFIKLGAIDSFPEMILKTGHNNAGVFPPEPKTAEAFAKIYAEANKQADVLTYWGFIMCEKYLMDKYAPEAEIIPPRPLEPFGFACPWIKALEGKKVLVVHPFAETIEKQYEKREFIHKNPDILPRFELKTFKAVQTSAGGECEFENWVQALEYMKSEIDKIDFDIALLGCGGYAVPLAAYIKEKGKKSVITGGFTQILFGIKGKRWERTRPDIVAMYNEHWVRPDMKEKPKKSDTVEENAYW